MQRFLDWFQRFSGVSDALVYAAIIAVIWLIGLHKHLPKQDEVSDA